MTCHESFSGRLSWAYSSGHYASMMLASAAGVQLIGLVDTSLAHLQLPAIVCQGLSKFSFPNSA